MNFRAAAKLLWFAGIVVIVCVEYFFTVGFVSSSQKRRARAAWMHRAARKFIRLFGCRPEVPDAIPARGLLVSNHLSYLDIVLLGSVTPAVFVSKADVKSWPLFGLLTRMAGTVYIERERRHHVGEVNREIETALADSLVIISPEGTSSDGRDVRPFRSSLLEPALRGGHDLAIAHIAYALPDGDAGEEVCYWAEHHTFFPHLLHLLGKKTVNARLRFGPCHRVTDDRKELASQLRDSVLRLKNS